MEPHLLLGDCRNHMRAMEPNSVDAICCDPPAGISFMGKSWDGNKGGRDQWIDWLSGVFREAYRVAKPGAHAVVWALPRTSGWTHRALEDAGWEIRDCVVHLFGSGFPKSHNLDGGLGTALKPAAEFWYLARKPLIGTVAQNVTTYGTGAINVDACRIGFRNDADRQTVQSATWYATPNAVYGKFEAQHTRQVLDGKDSTPDLGRWPANVILAHHEECREVGTKRVRGNASTGVAVRRSGVHADAGGHQTIGREQPRTTHADADGMETVTAWDCHPECAVRLLDAQSGERGGGTFAMSGTRALRDNPVYGKPNTTRNAPDNYGDTGGASRFYYTAKSSRRERNAGLGGPGGVSVNAHPT